MNTDYKEWLDSVIKNVSSILSCSIEEASKLVEETGEAESVYDTNTMITLATHELVTIIRKKNCKVQTRGTFTLEHNIFKQTVKPFCIDLDLSDWERDNLITYGRQKYHDIGVTKIIINEIMSLNMGYPEGDIMILSLEFWATEGAGWFQIPFKLK
jgi:hypothetical protein